MEGCRFFHHVLLHDNTARRVTYASDTGPSENTEMTTSSSAPTKSVSPVSGALNVAIIEGCDGPLRMLTVTLKDKNGNPSCPRIGFQDPGCSRTIMDKRLSNELGLQGDPIPKYRYQGLTGEWVEVNDAVKHNQVLIAGTFAGARFHKLKHVMTVDKINLRPYTFRLSEAQKIWPHLRKVRGSDLIKVVPDIIIGNDNPEALLPNRVIRGGEGDPIGLRTVLGWTVAGDFEVKPGFGTISATMCGEAETEDYLHNLMKSYWSTEEFGVRVSQKKGSTLDDQRAWWILEETTKRVEEGWETGLLYKKDGLTFPPSEGNALCRLGYIERKMKDRNYAAKYRNKIAEYLSKGYLRKLSPEEASVQPPNTWFLPHFGQINPNKPDKFRFITDAKAKANGVSLNDNLLTGPDLIQPLTSVLMNFRSHQIALTGDIADMFHRVKIRKEDRASQRLLWRDGDSSKQADHYQMEVMIFGATCSPTSAIYVKNRNAQDFSDKYPIASKIIETDFYVDDALMGGNSVKEVIELRKQISEINQAGGFKVCKYMSNSREVLESIPEDLRAGGIKGLEEKQDIPSERVLGLWWDPNEDIFSFKLCLHKVKESVLRGEVPTKREMCGLVMSLYDPLGFISQYRVKGLMLLQRTWQAGIGWDDEIPQEINEHWQSWLGNLQEITLVKVPRCYSSFLPQSEVQLHIFQDASEEGFCCVCYLRIKRGSQVDVALLCSKARVAPLKKLTIPKLELQAALLGVRMATTIGLELRVPISSRWFWSDSKTVLCWIRSTGVRFKEFVANRIGEIQENSNATEWHWVPTKLNVADLGTRFESRISMDPESEWYTGPAFLKQEPSEFPQENHLDEGMCAVTVLEVAPEVNRSDARPEHQSSKLTRLTETMPNPTRFSSFLRLLRATATVQKAAKLWRHSGNSELEPDDLLEAERTLVIRAQEESYADELESLRYQVPVSRKSEIWKLNPELDENGVLRMMGRVGTPAILPGKHYIAQLLIDQEHRNCAHQGIDTVFTNLRQKYWIPEGRPAVMKSWGRCWTCRLGLVKPIPPKMGCVPSFRLASYQPPFTCTGLDFFGPMYVTVGRQHHKRWVALFCCQVTRAVHLEVCHDLSTDEVMLAISRFVDTRGRPKLIVSDNGRNFVGAAKELKKAVTEIDFDRLKGLGKFHEVKWIFNPPAAPHMGGSWERLVQSVKKCLKAILHEKYPKDTTLLTMLKSPENIVNSRPLTHVSPDPADPEPITPNHILRGVSDVGPGIPSKVDNTSDYIRAQWKRAEIMTDQFWKIWTREFLPKLNRREKWNDPVKPLCVGDLVYMVDDNLPRNCWMKGFISGVSCGKDGQVRVVEVTTKDRETGRTTTYTRPAVKVCPLSLRMEIQNPTDPKFGAGNVNESQLSQKRGHRSNLCGVASMLI